MIDSTGIAGICGVADALLRRGLEGGSYQVDVCAQRSVTLLLTCSELTDNHTLVGSRLLQQLVGKIRGNVS